MHPVSLRSRLAAVLTASLLISATLSAQRSMGSASTKPLRVVVSGGLTLPAGDLKTYHDATGVHADASLLLRLAGLPLTLRPELSITRLKQNAVKVNTFLPPNNALPSPQAGGTTQLLGALGLMLVSREIHGRVTPFAVAAIPLLYGYPFNYGFINYTLSMALALLAYAAWLRLHRNGREVAAGLWLAVAGAAIWVSHTYGWAFLGLLTGSTMLAEVIRARTHPVRAVGRILAACWPLLLPIVPMVLWRAESAGPLASGWSLPFKFNWLFSPFRSVWKPMDIGALAVVAGLLYWVRLSRSAAFDLRVGIAALLCVAFFFILPSWVFGSAFADMRLLPYGLAVGLVAIGTAKVGARELRIAGAVALAFFGVRMAVTSAGYIEQDRVVQAALPAVDKMPEGARVAFFVIKPCAVRRRRRP